jgi:hypothetical protein
MHSRSHLTPHELKGLEHVHMWGKPPTQYSTAFLRWQACSKYLMFEVACIVGETERERCTIERERAREQEYGRTNSTVSSKQYWKFPNAGVRELSDLSKLPCVIQYCTMVQLLHMCLHARMHGYSIVLTPCPPFESIWGKTLVMTIKQANMWSELVTTYIMDMELVSMYMCACHCHVHGHDPRGSDVGKALVSRILRFYGIRSLRLFKCKMNVSCTQL